MALVRYLLCISFLSAGTGTAGAGCLQSGGCSDPCAAAACGGNGITACASCNVPQSAPCNQCGGHNVAAATGCNQCGAATTNVPTLRNELIDCGPVTSYKVVLEPQYVSETRAQCATVYQEEVRYRTRSVPRQVPVEVQDYRTTTVMVPKTETKTVEYTVLVPKTGEKSVEVSETVPVWTEVEDTYTVRVPTVVDVPEEYTVRVPKLEDEQFTYTVYVPQAQKQTKMQTVTNAVPVTRSRIIQVCRPVTRMQTVTKDYGHWEVRVEEAPAAAVPAASTPCSNGIALGGCGSYVSNSCGGCGGSNCGTSSCGGCGGSNCGTSSCGGCGTTACGGGLSPCGCGSTNAVAASVAGSNCAAATQMVSRRVWVPNVVSEEVPVVESVTESQEVTYTAFEQQTEQVPYECTYIVYAPETRTGNRQVVRYATETRTRTRKVVQYNEETRTRTRKELSYKQETRTETIPFVSYEKETRTKEVSYTVNVPETKVEPFTTTRFDTINEEVTEQYTVKVPVQTTKEVQVQVCRMVPKLVPITIYPCSSGSVSSATGTNGCTSCGSPAPAPAMPCSSCGG